MRVNVFHIALFLMCLPLMVLAQGVDDTENLGFYTTLAFKDARYEQTLQQFGAEDEADFWKDQRSFENILLVTNPTAHQTYLNGKHIAYGRHQQQCDGSCAHSDLYYRQASYYAINGTAVSNVLSTVPAASTASHTPSKGKLPK